ncbi:MAG: aspartate kinase [Gammaproteobacteria bacterium]|nr:MAG: aspartate kinase [Gammaproteobacteria bacterium]
MALLVQKFGGTSVGNIDKIKAVAKKIKQFRQQDNNIVVVVSAMTGETNRLIEMAETMQKRPTPRELDVLLSTGEQTTIALLAMALNEIDCSAISFTGHQVKIETDNSHNKARITDIDAEKITAQIDQGKVVIVAGFQGADQDGNITTLGRGGSDTTAVAIAAALKADECQIYTDVDGVYTTDPRIEPAAKRLNEITFEEMLEMASLGSKVLQIRSVEFAGKYNVPLRVLSTFVDGPGTLITLEESEMEAPVVSGIAFSKDEAKITVLGVPDTPGIAYKIIGPVSEKNIEVDMIIQNMSKDDYADFTFTVHRNDYDKAMEIVKETAERLGAREIYGDTKIVKISLVGVGMRSHAGVASKMFETFSKEGINIQMISTSEIKISVVVQEKYLELGVRTLHSAFKLDK